VALGVGASGSQQPWVDGDAGYGWEERRPTPQRSSLNEMASLVLGRAAECRRVVGSPRPLQMKGGEDSGGRRRLRKAEVERQLEKWPSAEVGVTTVRGGESRNSANQVSQQFVSA
jgi:hypothetical protein